MTFIINAFKMTRSLSNSHSQFKLFNSNLIKLLILIYNSLYKQKTKIIFILTK